MQAGMVASRLGYSWARHPGSDRPLEYNGGVVGPSNIRPFCPNRQRWLSALRPLRHARQVSLIHTHGTCARRDPPGGGERRAGNG